MSDERFKARLLLLKFGITGLFVGGLFLIIFGYIVYSQFRIDVPARHFAVLTKKTGIDLTNDQEISPDLKLQDAVHKGLQREVLPEGRYFYNCYTWDWEIYPMVEIPADSMGVRIRLYGEDLPPGDFMSTSEKHKGIIQEVLKPGRYAINALVIDRNTKKPVGPDRSKNDYIEIIELWEPKVIPAGYKGIVTNLAGPMPEDPNQLLVETNHRGPQKETLDEGTYYLNPYTIRINAIDTRSLRFDLSQGGVMMFPSKDGFPITLDFTGIWGLMPDQAAHAVRTFGNVDQVEKKVVLPQIESICRNNGSEYKAVQLLVGSDREVYQKTCLEQFHSVLDDKEITLLYGLVRHVYIPKQVREPIQMAFIADELKLTREEEQTTAKEEGRLREAENKVELATDTVDADTEKQVEEAKAGGNREAARIEAETEKLVAAIDKETEELKAQAVTILGEATNEGKKMVEEAKADRFRLAVDAFGSPQAYNNWFFATNLPEDVELNFLYAGEGTLWTDMNKAGGGFGVRGVIPLKSGDTTQQQNRTSR
ncbi:SPFH domain / Band 7 family protein [Gimesia panareensis]|uniref:SPFH domain / Band 7 family protein n=1 Tax=Gimesia panareensis TaxID=2527978 RepID=A0A517QB18_9PLAN|nr:SPFH domain-containing protein [Gimesia panareensis]QDT28818.1 SPFH domain / Band 7 family protein [Gimesia panareensis]